MRPRAAAQAAPSCSSGWRAAPRRLLGVRPLPPPPVAAAAAAAAGRRRLVACASSARDSPRAAPPENAKAADHQKEELPPTLLERLAVAATLLAGALLLLWLVHDAFVASAWSLPAVPWGPWNTAGIVALYWLVCWYMEDVVEDIIEVDAAPLIPYIAMLQGFTAIGLLWVGLARYDPLALGLFAAPLQPLSAWMLPPIAAAAALEAILVALMIASLNPTDGLDEDR